MSKRTLVKSYVYDGGGRINRWSVALDSIEACASLTYGPMGNIATEAFANNVRRAYTYDCHGWIEGITTSIPAAVSVLPELQGSVSNDFYRGATMGGQAADAIEPTPLYKDYTEQIMYATGSHPRYDGTASAHVATVGGRYDYLFDCHDRLIKAAYSAAEGISALGGDVDYTENFSTEYTYNPVGVPLTVKRYGVQRIDNSSGTATEQFGILDNLSYSYDGMLLSSVLAYGAANGADYYGRPGFPLSYQGGIADYGWNGAGLLNKDSSRGITDISYNWNGQPTTINFTDKGYMSYTYTAAGALRSVATYAMLGGKRATLVSRRTYCGDFVFEGDSLLYANFGGGYFDGDGQPHYRHSDFQGNITMVTDGQGQVEQHTGYYPYGEPWREPDGQPYLYGGKERMRDHALNEYDFGPRRLNSALALWTAPDPLATDYAPTSPYSYCAGNPIKYTDPTGREVKGVSKKDAERVVEDFRAMLQDDVFAKFRELIVQSGKKQNGKSLAKISPEAVSKAFENVTLNEDQQALVETIINTINSDEIHVVEYQPLNGTLSSSGEDAFLPGYMAGKAAHYMPQILEKNGGLPIRLVANDGGDGATVKTSKGTHTVIVIDGTHQNGRAVTTGHEILGHGRSLSLGYQNVDQHVQPIRMENLILRVMGIPYINNGTKHGPRTPVPNPTMLPSYR